MHGTQTTPASDHQDIALGLNCVPGSLSLGQIVFSPSWRIQSSISKEAPFRPTYQSLPYESVSSCGKRLLFNQERRYQGICFRHSTLEHKGSLWEIGLIDLHHKPSRFFSLDGFSTATHLFLILNIPRWG